MAPRARDVDAEDADPIDGGIDRPASAPHLVVLRGMADGGRMQPTQRTGERHETALGDGRIATQEQIF